MLTNTFFQEIFVALLLSIFFFLIGLISLKILNKFYQDVKVKQKYKGKKLLELKFKNIISIPFKFSLVSLFTLIGVKLSFDIVFKGNTPFFALVLISLGISVSALILAFDFINFLFLNFLNIKDKSDKRNKDITFASRIVNIFMKIISLSAVAYLFFSLIGFDVSAFLEKDSTLRSLVHIFFIFIIDAIFIAVGFIFYHIVRKVFQKWADKTKTKLDDIVLDFLETPLIFLFVFLGIKFSFSLMDLNLFFETLVIKVSEIVIGIFLTILALRIVDVFYAEFVIPKVKKTKDKFDDQLAPILKSFAKILIIVIAIIIAIEYFGYSASSILAGLGIGGLAFALAAQDTLGNMFGSVSIFLDKPFQIDERIKFDGYDGFVQEVGIRSTRIRTLEGNLLSVPNSQLSKQVIENVTLRPSIKINVALGLVYETSRKDMEKAISIIKEILSREFDNGLLQEGHNVFFEGFGDFSLNIRVMFWILELDWGKAMEIKEKIFLEILERFNAEGLEFAFPSQTIYLSK